MPQSAPLTPVELRLLTSFNQVGLETLRKGLLSSISLATGVELRARAVTLTAHQNDFRAVFTDVLRLPAAVCAKVLPNRVQYSTSVPTSLYYAKHCNRHRPSFGVLGFRKGILI